MRLVIRIVLVIAAGIALAVAWKRLRGEPATEFNDEKWPADEPWPSIAEQTEGEPRNEPSSTWVEPDSAGACPASHPVKAKLDSGIYHEPGALNYERTHADRCYVDGAAAAADGMRKAKR